MMARAILNLKRPITKFEVDIEENDLEANGYVRARHGHWIYKKRLHNSCWAICSECKKFITFFFKEGTKYCPHCGARMDKEVWE